MNTKRHVQYWVIPPEANAEFVAHMEDVLDVYSRPYDPHVPVLCMDEQPVQLVQEVKVPIPATHHHPKRVDYEYKRAGVANVFMFAEPLAMWRQVSVRAKKTKVDWAIERYHPVSSVKVPECRRAASLGFKGHVTFSGLPFFAELHQHGGY